MSMSMLSVYFSHDSASSRSSRTEDDIKLLPICLLLKYLSIIMKKECEF